MKIKKLNNSTFGILIFAFSKYQPFYVCSFQISTPTPSLLFGFGFWLSLRSKRDSLSSRFSDFFEFWVWSYFFIWFFVFTERAEPTRKLSDLFKFWVCSWDNRKERWNKEYNRKKEIKCKEMAFLRGINEFVYL